MSAPGLLDIEPFVPHTMEHLTKRRVFPSPFPPEAYDKLRKEYESLTDVIVSRIAYVSDGLKVTGLMALPVNRRPGAHPILIYNRGGSRDYGKLTLLSVMRSMAPFAQKGYLVFASNYRGVEGGEGIEEFGGKDVDDVMNLLAVAHTQPEADGTHAYMIGHSRGGMMTALAIKRGARLNAAVSIAGIADAREMAKSPLMLEHVLMPLIPHYRERPMEALTERSAVCWPEAITVPLLLLHGDADKDVPMTQSIALASALEVEHREHELVIYPGGNHALVRHWDEVTARCLSWLEEHRA